MSQQRARKVSASSAPAEAPRARASCGKATGDSNLQNTNRVQQLRSRSKIKIPKNIRYDLDNALVGLCDVWFEDIKPHLIRNKIKVHIQGEGAFAASGDHQRAVPGAPGCSHFDPGAASDRHRHQFVNFADCYATRPTALRAPCPKPPAPAPPTSPLQLLLQSLSVQQEYKSAKKYSRPQKSDLMQRQSYPRREPPVSQTNAVLPPTHHRSRYRDIPLAVPKCKTKMKDAGTQTLYSWPPSSVTTKIDKETQTSRIGIGRRKTSARAASNVYAGASPMFDRCPGKTTLLASRLKSRTRLPSTFYNERRRRDDVAKANPKLIEVLFRSPHSSIFNSSITLSETPQGNRRRKDAGKKPPWR